MKKALLVFARQPVAGRVKTRLSPPLSAHDAAELYRCMLADTLDRVTLLRQVDVILFFDPSDGAEAFFREAWPGLTSFPQEGDGLGERLENAFGRVFGLGFTVAAAMGTDSPDLPLAYLEDAFRTLEESAADVIFGPTTDGGYYLVAMGMPCPELFRAIPWSTGRVLEESLARAAATAQAVTLLPVWEDMDTIAELRRFILRQRVADAPLTWKYLKSMENPYC